MSQKPFARRPFVGGNWKSNGSRKFVADLVAGLNKGASPAGVEVVVAPTFLHLDYVERKLKKGYSIASQDVSLMGNGAYTGNVSATMIRDFGLNWAILGHSERRGYHQESCEQIAKKLVRCQEQQLSVILCIGESLEEREAGTTMEVVEKQLLVPGAAVTNWNNIVIAYEPVWAIGTGKTATKEQAQEVHAHLRKVLRDNYGEVVAATTRIIYGGSVKEKNSAALMSMPDIDGFLVGGASLKAPSFINIAKNAGLPSKL
jgi:triosephosphate isomerase